MKDIMEGSIYPYLRWTYYHQENRTRIDVSPGRMVTIKHHDITFECHPVDRGDWGHYSAPGKPTRKLVAYLQKAARRAKRRYRGRVTEKRVDGYLCKTVQGILISTVRVYVTPNDPNAYINAHSWSDVHHITRMLRTARAVIETALKSIAVSRSAISMPVFSRLLNDAIGDYRRLQTHHIGTGHKGYLIFAVSGGFLHFSFTDAGMHGPLFSKDVGYKSAETIDRILSKPRRVSHD